jgi:ATP-dependent exoDNAse (exonuclease V) beta subunit
MTETIDKPLLVLNASAGSGKTYNLVMTYLKLILGENRSTQSFAHIMAMTFTNKAALEMKTRIISALDLLANPNRESEKEQNKAAQLANDVSRELGLEKASLQLKAKKGLKQILHQYEDFHVMTIDKFNLRLIRSFSKDLDLPADFNIVLDEDQVLEQVIDTLLDNLDAKSQQKLTRLVINYSKDKLDEQEGWNFQHDLQEFAKVLTNEKYFDVLDELLAGDYSDTRYQEIKLQFKAVEASISNKATELFSLFSTFDPSTLPGKSNNVGAFNKLTLPLRQFKFSGEAISFFTNAMLTHFEKSDYPSSLAQAALEFQHFFDVQFQEYKLLQLQVKNFYNMALLQFIYTELVDVRKNEQLIRISEFNRLISDLIKNEDAPFIYEKLGVRFHHFLLDEFQDTSRLQWMNIVPLLHESISAMHENLIVGDPKQSIYRFKNGIAEQFVALPSIYNPENDSETNRRSAYFEKMGSKKPLEDNWRSFQEIVKFNNAFFTSLQKKDIGKVHEFYKDVVQNPRGKEGGYVSIVSEIIDKADDANLFRVETKIHETVEACIQDGYLPGDICLLGNTKKDCNAWAQYLSACGYKVVSSDSLLVNSDKYVQLTIAYFKWCKNPEGEMEARRFSEKYFSLTHENALVELQKYWKQKENQVGKLLTYFDHLAFLEFEFESEMNFFTSFENLYGLTQHFYRLLHLEEIKNPYLHHLSDLIQEFELKNGPDLELFLDLYERKFKDSSIQIPENKDAIKIMTGHKSKGLEFPIVIVPTLDWSIDGKRSSFLLKHQSRFVYSELSATNNLLFIRDKHSEENALNTLDKINLCYVMFTRPIERLYIQNYFELKANRFGSIFHTVLQDAFPNLEETQIELELGTPSKSDGHDEATSIGSYSPISLQDRLWFPDISLQHHAFGEEPSLIAERRFGTQLHLLLSNCEKAEDVDSILHELVTTGKIEQDFVQEIEQKAKKTLLSADYLALVDGASRILNEQEIIISATETKRPDKLIFRHNTASILDFKTGKAALKDKKQVQLYKETLEKMGYSSVKGFLFYTEECILEEV